MMLLDDSSVTQLTRAGDRPCLALAPELSGAARQESAGIGVQSTRGAEKGDLVWGRVPLRSTHESRIRIGGNSVGAKLAVSPEENEIVRPIPLDRYCPSTLA
jgi:hypothetical protein